MKRTAGATSTIPADLQAAPPRAVRRRGGFPFGLIAMRLFILPFAAIGIGALLRAVGEPMLIMLTPEQPGEVNDVSSSHSSRGGSRWHLNFAYKPGESGGVGEQIDNDEITKDEAQVLHRGDRIAVHAITIGSFHYATLSRSFGMYVRNRWFLSLWALGWNAGVGGFVWVSWVTPMRERKLVREGEAVTGNITGKYVSHNKSTSYHVKYRFSTHCLRPSSRDDEMLITRKQYDVTNEGDAVIILYDPERPKRNLIYDFCEFVAVRS